MSRFDNACRSATILMIMYSYTVWLLLIRAWTNGFTPPSKTMNASRWLERWHTCRCPRSRSYVTSNLYPLRGRVRAVAKLLCVRFVPVRPMRSLSIWRRPYPVEGCELVPSQKKMFPNLRSVATWCWWILTFSARHDNRYVTYIYMSDRRGSPSGEFLTTAVIYNTIICKIYRRHGMVHEVKNSFVFQNHVSAQAVKDPHKHLRYDPTGPPSPIPNGSQWHFARRSYLTSGRANKWTVYLWYHDTQ